MSAGIWEAFDGGLDCFVIRRTGDKRRVALVPYEKKMRGKAEGYDQAEADAHLIVAALNAFDDHRFERDLSQALNEGDGVYRP